MNHSDNEKWTYKFELDKLSPFNSAVLSLGINLVKVVKITINGIPHNKRDILSKNCCFAIFLAFQEVELLSIFVW